MPAIFDKELVKRAAEDNWPEIISHLTDCDHDILDGGHHPCPKCGGADRFRMIDSADGACLCNKCFRTGNHDGFAVIMWLTGKDFPAALEAVANHLNIPSSTKPLKKRGKPKPDENLEWLEWSDMMAGVWAADRPPITPEVMKRFGCRMARYRGRYLVLAFPVFGPQADAPPIGWFIYSASGNRELPRYEAGNKQAVEYLSKKFTSGSKSGFFNQEGVESIHRGQAAGKLVWKVEGPTDAMSLQAAAEEADQGEGVLVVSNSGGSEEDASKHKWMAELFKGLDVRVIHDNDDAGRSGAEKWAAALHAYAETAKIASLPESVGQGGDVRSFLAGGATYATVYSLPLVDPSSDSIQEATLVPITNFKTVSSSDGEPTRVPLTMNELIELVETRFGGWPRRTGGKLFVHSGQSIDWLEKKANMFGWMQRQAGIIEWASLSGSVNKEEFFVEFLRTAEQHSAIEHNPHFPPIPGHYYTCDVPEPGDGSHLEKLIDFFAPETPHDRQMIKALFTTCYWGGESGSRPAFVVTSDAGPGVGKSKLTDMASYLLGGDDGSAIEVKQHEDADVIIQRMLSPVGMVSRIARLDNVKSLRFSWAELESLITMQVISGKALYIGEARRPNSFTWAITLNGVNLSTDMAQRSVIIHLQRPSRDPFWEINLKRFIDQHREKIAGDIRAFFAQPARPIEVRSRWANWEREVLGRLEKPNLIQALLKARSEGADADAEEAEILREYFLAQTITANETGEPAPAQLTKIHIPANVAARFFNEATGEKKTVKASCAVLRRYIKEGKIPWLAENPSRKNGRGFLLNSELTIDVDYEFFPYEPAKKFQ